MKICSKCNIEKELSEFYKLKTSKYGVMSKCKSCYKEYYENNKDKIKDKMKEYQEINKDKLKEYREINKDKLREYSKEYREINKDKLKEYQQSDKYKESRKEYQQSDKIKEYRENNKEAISKYNQEYNLKNAEERKRYKKEYTQSDKGKLINKVSGQNYRAKGLRLNNEITKEKVLSLFESQNKSCTYCNEELSLSERESYHIDHIQPLSRGGDNNDDNIQLLCPHCNRSKHDKNHEEYLEYLKLKNSIN